MILLIWTKASSIQDLPLFLLRLIAQGTHRVTHWPFGGYPVACFHVLRSLSLFAATVQIVCIRQSFGVCVTLYFKCCEQLFVSV